MTKRLKRIRTTRTTRTVDVDPFFLIAEDGVRDGYDDDDDNGFDTDEKDEQNNWQKRIYYPFVF